MVESDTRAGTDSAFAFLQNAAQTALYEAVQKPLDGLRQLGEHAGVQLPPMQLVSAPADDTGAASTIGKLLGGGAQFWLASTGIGRLTGLGQLKAVSTWSGEALKLGATGTVVGLLQPVAEDQFGWRKTVAVAEGLASSAVFGASAGGLNQVGFLGRAGFRSFGAEACVNALSGGLGGLAGDAVHLLAPADKTQLPEAGMVGSSGVSGAALGFGMTLLDRALFGRTKISLRMADGTVPKPALSTEEWAANHYDGAGLRSPILTLLAEEQPALRPANFEQLRAQAWRTYKPQEFSLGDWAPEQRPQVIAALRKTANTDLASDANLTAFVDRINQREIVSATERFARHAREVDNAEIMLRRELDKEGGFTPVRFMDLKYHRSGAGVPVPSEAATAFRDTMQQSESRLYGDWIARNVDQVYQKELTAMAQEIGLPPVKFSAMQGVRGQYEFDVPVGAMSSGLSGGMTAYNLESVAHEFNHHRQGLVGHEPYVYALRRFLVDVPAKRLGLIENIRPLQDVKDIASYRNGYVSTTIEREAFALGFLARLRAMMSGLPQGLNTHLQPT